MKFFSLIMSFVLSLFGVVPPAQSVDAYTQAEWYALVAEEFALTYSLEDNDNYDIAADDEYFAAVQACHDNNVIVGEYDADAYVTNVLVGKSLAVAVGLEGTEIPDDVAFDVAVEAGFVKVSVNIFGKSKEVVITKEEADAALEAAKAVYLKNIQAYTQAEWYALVAKEFDLAYDLEDEDNYDIAAGDKYFEAVQACHDNKVIVGEYVADAQITNILVAKSLIVAVGLKLPGVSDEVAVNVAVNAGFVDASVTICGEVKEVVITKAEANVALKAAGLVYLNTNIAPKQPS
jgi:flagellar hook-basal body complex protein FliE